MTGPRRRVRVTPFGWWVLLVVVSLAVGYFTAGWTWYDLEPPAADPARR